MSIKNDKWIQEKCTSGNMITPFSSHQITREGGYKIISYGLSSMGYDIRCAPEFMVASSSSSETIDPKAFDLNLFDRLNCPYCVIPGNSFALSRSVEYINMPKNVVAVCVGKSTYARCGLVVNVTPIEPEWEGIITLELSNTTPLPIKVYANEGIAQLLFFESDSECLTSYADRNGKYQGQTGITTPIL